MRVIGIIPARKGSKRLINKNIYPLNGKPLVEYTIEAALNSKYLDKDNIYINTDFKEVKDIGLKFNLNIIDRPEELSGDNVWTQEVVNHTTTHIGDIEEEDIIIILQANSPQISSKVIDEIIDMLINKNLWQVHTVDEELINNGALQAFKYKLRNHKGKANYNGVIITNWVDVHTIQDIKLLEKIL